MKEKFVSSLEGDHNLKRKNILQRLKSSPWLQRILLASLLIIFTPADIKKDEMNNEKIKDKTEVLDENINKIFEDSLDNDSIINDNNSLSPEEYKKNIDADPPVWGPAPKPKKF